MKYELQRWRRTLLVAAPLVAAGMWVIAAFRGEPLVELAFGLLVVAAVSFGCLDIPHEMELSPDGSVAFRSVLRRRTVSCADITAIDARRGNRGFITIRSRKTVVSIQRVMPGARELLDAVRRDSPTAVIRGDL